MLGAWQISPGLGFTSMFGAFSGVLPNVSVSDAQGVSESGTGAVATFTISLSAPASPHGVTVNYSTASGTAQVGSDFTSTSGTLILDPGVTTGVVTVPILDDGLDEPDETFLLNIAANLGIITRAQGSDNITSNRCGPMSDNLPPRRRA